MNNNILEADRSLTPRPIRHSRSLSRAIDRAVVQVEAAEATGDAETARAWHRVLAGLLPRIPETRP